jgi:outer membrane protein assembly factor BamB
MHLRAFKNKANLIKIQREKMKYFYKFPVFVLLLLLLNDMAAAQEWTQWRGPNRDGVVTDFSTPDVWPAKLVRKWTANLGGGHSSPVFSQTSVYVHSRQNQQEVVSCLNLQTGKILWRTSYEVPSTKNVRDAATEGEGPYSTPILYQGRLFTLGVSAILSCFDATSGQLRWRRDFSKQVISTNRFCGTAMSPVINGRLIFVQVGDDQQGEVVALDNETGRQEWRCSLGSPGYASPVIARLEGILQLITLTDQTVVGIAVDTGKRLWSFPFESDKSGCSQNVITPILDSNLIILSAQARGILAIRPVREQNKWTIKQIWHNRDIFTHLSTPVLDQGFLYGFSPLRKGQFFCLNARTGEIMWTSNGREGDQAIVLSLGKVLTFVTTDARMIVAQKSEKSYETIAQYIVADSAVWASPIFVGKQILIKDTSTLALWSLE